MHMAVIPCLQHAALRQTESRWCACHHCTMMDMPARDAVTQSSCWLTPVVYTTLNRLLLKHPCDCSINRKLLFPLGQPANPLNKVTAARAVYAIPAGNAVVANPNMWLLCSPDCSAQSSGTTCHWTSAEAGPTASSWAFMWPLIVLLACHATSLSLWSSRCRHQV